MRRSLGARLPVLQFGGREMIVQIFLSPESPVEPTPEVFLKLHSHFRKNVKKFPDVCEGSIWLDGVEHFFTYVVENGIGEMFVMVRADAEKHLNKNGLSTHEPFNPLRETQQ
jgi:hypothetical protein